ncbi:MAG: endolytic transglycosylase MltG [Dysgonamonadaceae bacterium]|jgi:UPF0755 protein|nr:endolytic transglycosylase MltG [Dysgonamonadaceae bacterium]MDD3308340.1 endolytic transglycosylase MltG [Dysgonamonadaceae bacterium]MDD3900277.1 endolytic transglycosylase MltG [Dysgonamonadaceae bacterium]MDD4398833.1 endolytic transglycosylase MltG [Dysgonamonadaceae bacterium]MEA5080957.1 endolytic transglycosylase MltG [Dysgonamonadaceae bacterium]
MSSSTNIKRAKFIAFSLSIIIIMLGLAGISIYNMLYKQFHNTESVYIYIDSRKNFDDLLNQLKEKANLSSDKTFRLFADKMNYKNNMRTGRYELKKGESTIDFIRKLRSGNQSPINITFNNIRTKEDLSGRIATQLMIDSTELLSTLNDSAKVATLGFNSSTIVSMFIPNTYEVYWDTSIDKMLKRMKKEYDGFWNDERKAKAKKIGLTQTEVSTLASIVEEECTYSDEYPVVAGLYLNRIKKNIPLQADPTVKFAVGDFTLKRILFKHLEIDSPYNTYKSSGLPPGPIRIPSIKSIDGTLNAQNNNYLYMCAKEDLSGRHNFATNLSEHNANASRYQRALNERRIF